MAVAFFGVLAEDEHGCNSWLGSTHHLRNGNGSNAGSISVHRAAVCSLMQRICFGGGTEGGKQAPGRKWERCCVINSAAHGCSEGFQTWLDAPSRSRRQPRANAGPMLHAASRVTRASMRGLFPFACFTLMYVFVLSAHYGKCSLSSSSFGTKGNTSQMDVISPNRLQPAAQ